MPTCRVCENPARIGRKYCSRRCHGAALRIAANTPERFWARTQKRPTGCIEWTGYRMPNGYGLLWWKGERLLAHRVAFSLIGGTVPAGAHLMHSCDNPRCVNPEHLTPGSPSENARQAVERGRIKAGQMAHAAKISDAQATALRELRAKGVLVRVLAAAFGLSEAQVSRIANGVERACGPGRNQ